MAVRNRPKATWKNAPLTSDPEAKSDCPMCKGGHEPCRFQAGSLYCVTHSCANPHHRSKA